MLLIHGIGEQRPLDTLRGFTKAVWQTDGAIHHGYAPPTLWSKPDRISGSFELRRMTTAQNRAEIRTDFFEMYWAHLLAGTSLSQVWAWLKVLVFRNPASLPKALRAPWVLIVVALVLAGFLASNGLQAGDDRWIDVPGWLSLLLSAGVIPLLGAALRNVVGDAARYLHPAPGNIEGRRAIRETGVEALKRLHQQGYDRIIVVGHSLGSVIGYDVLTYSWPQYHGSHGRPSEPIQPALDHAESLARAVADEPGSVDPEVFQQAQRAFLEEQIALGCEWRVTDFVTLGSPLAHAEVLLARDDDDLANKVASREMPTCPPELEQPLRRGPEERRFSFERTYTDNAGAKRTLRVPHHAAVFGATRWTNIYFPVEGVLWGDVIAGPIAPVLGRGIRDVPVRTRERGGMLSHTLYWSVDEPVPQQTAALRRALDLVDANGS